MSTVYITKKYASLEFGQPLYREMKLTGTVLYIL